MPNYADTKAAQVPMAAPYAMPFCMSHAWALAARVGLPSAIARPFVAWLVDKFADRDAPAMTVRSACDLFRSFKEEVSPGPEVCACGRFKLYSRFAIVDDRSDSRAPFVAHRFDSCQSVGVIVFTFARRPEFAEGGRS